MIIVGVQHQYHLSVVELGSCTFSNNLICSWYYRDYPTSKCVRNETNIIWNVLEFTEEGEIYKPSTMGDLKTFHHGWPSFDTLRVNFSSHAKTIVFSHMQLLLNLTWHHSAQMTANYYQILKKQIIIWPTKNNLGG